MSLLLLDFDCDDVQVFYVIIVIDTINVSISQQ